ncbi:MAG: hypothetical protein R2827_15255 [Bdellovibrionales bacterium]
MGDFNVIKEDTCMPFMMVVGSSWKHSLYDVGDMNRVLFPKSDNPPGTYF